MHVKFEPSVRSQRERIQPRLSSEQLSSSITDQATGNEIDERKKKEKQSGIGLPAASVAWQAVCVRGVAAHARESRGIAGSHTTPAGRGSTKFMTAREKSEFDE